MSNAKAHRPPPEETRPAQDRGDRHLVERFVADRDEDAFTELVRRHGGSVWSLCRRVLGREQDVEDAFQATFLVLARKASAIRSGEAVGSWLYAVAYRTAMKARQNLARQQKAIAGATPPSVQQAPVSDVAFRELQRLLDDELQRLPEKYRAPFILCCLQGLSRPEAAAELGWTEGTVSGRIARARDMLQKRLARHGIALSWALTAAAVAQGTAATAAPPVLVASTAQGALASLSGNMTLSPTALALADGVVKGMAGLKALAGPSLLLTLALGATAALVTLQSERGPAPLPAPSLREAHTFQQPALPLVNPTDERVLAVAVSPDGQRLATVGAFWPRPGHVTIWDIPGRKALASVRDIPPVRSVAFAPDGRTLATGDFKGMLTLRHGQTGAEIAVVKAHEIGVNGVAFAPDGRTLATAGLDNTVKLWDAASLQQLKAFPGHTDWVLTVAFFRHGRAFVTGGKDATLRIWDVERGSAQATIATGQPLVESVAVAPDDRTIATASWTGTVKLWDAETGGEQATLSVPRGGLLSVAFSPDGKRLAAAASDGKIHVWDAKTYRTLAVLDKHAGGAWSLAFTPDSATLASGGADGTAQLWDAEKGTPTATLVVGRPAVSSVAAIAYAPDGKAFAAARGETIELCDASSGAILQRWTEHKAAVTCLAFAPDGSSVASGSDDRTIIVWDRATGARRQVLQGHAGGVAALCFSPAGQTLASAGVDQAMKVWDPAAGREIASWIVEHPGDVAALAFTRDGQQLASGGADGVIQVWDVATRTAGPSMREHKAAVRSLAFAPNGTLASAGDDAAIRLWHPARDGAVSRILRGPGDVMSALAFSPGGHTLVSGGWSGALMVWDPVAGVPRQRLDSSATPITALAFDPEGEALLSSSSGAVMRWQGVPAPPDAPAETLPERLYHDFRAGRPPAPPLALYYRGQDFRERHALEGAVAAAVSKAEPGGLRITLAADQDRRAVWVLPTVPISGDFDVSASYELVSTERPRNGFGVGVGLVLSSRGADKMAKLYRLVRTIEGECYLADLTDGKKTAQRVKTKLVPTLAQAGRLRLVREGATLRYLVAEQAGHGFREIHREDFGTHDVNEMKVMVTSHESTAAIDARLVDLRIRAGGPAPTLAQAPPPPAEVLPEKFYQDFRGGRPPLPPLELDGPEDAEAVTRAEAEGLRITLPANRKKRGVWVLPRLVVSGDFDIIAGYELLEVERPLSGAGAGVCLIANSPAGKKTAKLCRLVRAQEGERYLADITHHLPKPKIATKMVATVARQGQLRLVREGATLRYLVAEAADEQFREIHRDEFGTADVTEIKLAITSHDSEAAVDGRLIDLRIRAGRFTTLATQPSAPVVAVAPEAAAAPDPDDAGPRIGREGRHWLALAVSLFAFLALAGLAASVIRHARRAPQPNAPLPPRVTCTGCGQSLQVGAAHAGRKVKCGHCGAPVLVPAAAERQATTPQVAQETAAAKPWIGALTATLVLLAGGVVFVISMPGRPAVLDVPLGTQPVTGIEESGFHNQEFDGSQRPFRWTNGTARLVVPLDRGKLPRALVVRFLPSRPAAAQPATLQLVANEQVLFQGEIANGALDRKFELDPATLGDRLTLDILSNTFVPQALPNSKSGDTRPLGLRVANIRLLGPAE